MIHLPEDVGDRPSKVGQKTKDNSYSVALAFDKSVKRYEVDIADGSPINTSDTYQDLLGNQRRIKSKIIFRSTSRYDIESTQWSFTTADYSTGDTTSSILWTGRVNTRATYPGTTPSVKYSFQNSAARLECLPFPVSGLQQALLYSNRVFTPSMGAPIFISFAVKMSLSLSPDVKKQWGWFNGDSGYFFQIKADGSGDNFSIIRRTNFGVITEEETVRSKFNGNKLSDLNFTNITMFAIELGVGCGYNARFWAFILGKWVLIHSLNTGAGTLQNPSINERSLPIAFSIYNTNATNDTQTLFRYGTSVSTLGEVSEDNAPNEISVTKNLSAIPGSTWVLLGVRTKQDINSIQNSNILLLSGLQGFSGNNLCTLFLLKNPEIDTSLIWTSLPGSGVEFNTTRLFSFTGGQRINLSIPASSGASINLNKLFSVQRDFGSAQYSNDIQLSNDTGYQSAIKQDTYWLCATYLGFKPIMLENDLAWDTSTSVNTSITSNGSINSYITYAQKTIFNITASLSFLEV